MKSVINQVILIIGCSIIGWVIAKKYIKIRKTNYKEISDLVSDEEELFYKEEELNSVPDELRELLDCSVDLCIFFLILGCLKSPVVSPNGITFENNSIREWLKRKNICPVTKRELNVKDLRFNRNVRNLINFLVLRDRYNRINPDDIIKIEEILK